MGEGAPICHVTIAMTKMTNEPLAAEEEEWARVLIKWRGMVLMALQAVATTF